MSDVLKRKPKPGSEEAKPPGINKWQADAYREGDTVTLELSEAKLPGSLRGRLEKVGDRTFLIYPEKPLEIFLSDVTAVKDSRRPNENHTDALQDIVPSHVETIYPDDPRYKRGSSNTHDLGIEMIEKDRQSA